MVNKTTGTFKTININKDFKTSYGTINRKAPSSIFINVAGWVNIPTDEPIVSGLKDKRNNSTRLLKHSKGIKQSIYNSINKELFIGNRTLLISDIAAFIPSNKPNYYNYEVNIYQKDKPLLLTEPAIQNEITKVFNIIIENLQNQENIIYTKSK
jgi:hypothetical protein